MCAACMAVHVCVRVPEQQRVRRSSLHQWQKKRHAGAHAPLIKTAPACQVWRLPSGQHCHVVEESQS